MSLPYYVEPEYWVEGYAVGDAKIASASTSISVIFAASGRLKWETEADTPETWTEIPSVSEIWTEVAQ